MGFVTIPDSFRNCLTNPYLVQKTRQPPRRNPLGHIAVAGRGVNGMSRKHYKTYFVGVEAVDATHYRRTDAIDPHRGWLATSLGAQRNAL